MPGSANVVSSKRGICVQGSKRTKHQTHIQIPTSMSINSKKEVQ